MRIPRFKVPDVTPDGAPFGPGTSVRLTEGDDVTIIAIGTMVSRALEAADRLRRDGIARARDQHAAFVDPLDEQAVLEAASETRGIVTAEEATVSGGLGAAVAALVVEHQPVPMRILGIRGEFAPTGSTSFLLDHFGLNRGRHRPRRTRGPGPPSRVIRCCSRSIRARAPRRRYSSMPTGRSSRAPRAPVGQSHPQPGWVEQSAAEIWDSVRAAVADCLARHDAAAVAAVGLSTQRESLVLWERGSGDAVGPLLSWQDQRTAPHCARLRREGAGDRVRALSGLPVDPMFSAPKATLAARRARSRPRAQPTTASCAWARWTRGC